MSSNVISFEQAKWRKRVLSLTDSDLLEWETKILQRLGYFDSEEGPRDEMFDQFFDSEGQLKAKLFREHEDLMPETRGVA